MILDGKLRVATEKDCKAPWGGVKGGRHFRCCFCGYRFKPGDKWKVQYTNDMKDAPGNPLVCEKCDSTPEELRERWRQKWKEWKSMKTKEWWWFMKRVR